MALILNIETSSQACSVCISRDGQLLLEKGDVEGTNHASTLAVFIQQLFEETELKMDDLDAVAVSCGPGSYTGLRIGTVTAKGLCYSLNKPLIAIDSLQALASGLEKKFPERNLIYCTAIDARRNEIYFGLFGKDAKEILPSHNIILTFAIPFTIPENHIAVVGGSGAVKCQSAWQNNDRLIFDHSIVSLASNMIILSEKKFYYSHFENVSNFEPHYIKPVYIRVQGS